MIDSGVWHMHFVEKTVGLGLIEQLVDAMTDPVQVCLDICHAFFYYHSHLVRYHWQVLCWQVAPPYVLPLLN